MQPRPKMSTTWTQPQLPGTERTIARMSVTVWLDPSGWSVQGFTLVDPLTDELLAMEAWTVGPCTHLVDALRNAAQRLQEAGEAHVAPF